MTLVLTNEGTEAQRPVARGHPSFHKSLERLLYTRLRVGNWLGSRTVSKETVSPCIKPQIPTALAFEKNAAKKRTREYLGPGFNWRLL